MGRTECLKETASSPMSRGVDVTFYRLLWITLVAVAITFSVILTSVFVDIDGLLAKNFQPAKPHTTDLEVNKPNPEPVEDLQTWKSNEDDDPEQFDSAFRTKRSLETNNLIYQIKSPKMKKILTNHLATLLEELDQEEALQSTNRDEFKPEIIKPKYISDSDTRKNEDQHKEVMNEKFRGDVKNNDLLHLAMHNILLQGIIGHMDLNEVYKKVHLLIQSLNGKSDSDSKEIKDKDEPTEIMKMVSQDSYNDENKFFEELMKCDKLKKQISDIKTGNNEYKNTTYTEQPLLIKTIIEINNNEKAKNLTNRSKNIKGLIKLLYNGRPVKLEGISGEDVKEKHIERTENSDIDNRNPVLDNAIAEYLRTHTYKLQNNRNFLTKESIETKRLKRQIKIRYKDHVGPSSNPKRQNTKPKKNDNEVYVEIETHFDGKGAKGEKKKKLIRSLIDKIQKAVNSNIDVADNHHNNNEIPLKIKKRMQNPIDRKEDLPSLASVNLVEPRLVNPISKTVTIVQPLKSVLDKYGDKWKKISYGPTFLTPTKSLNSAEMSEVDVDYKTVLRNGIPKRLQKPLNTEDDDLIRPNADIPNSNVTLYLKEIDGSGFAIGINQYLDEPPDKESLQMFTGLESLIKAYHEQYDQRDISSETNGRTQYIVQNNDEDIIEDATRKRRSVNVKLFSNLKSKTKLNKFLNTKPMQTKQIFQKNKRNKRHIDKIRIIASDKFPKTSKEKIFLVSHEDIFSDRIVKGDTNPEAEIGDRDPEYYDYVETYPNPPRLPYINSVYDTNTLQSGLMSQYPHIFVENIHKSKEEFLNISPYHDEETMETNEFPRSNSEITANTLENIQERNISLPSVDSIIKAISPHRTNYKLSVKIVPKNNTNLGPGYKEVHTTINKSYDQNGLRYISSVNVSEISKFEKLNKTDPPNTRRLQNDDIDIQKEKIRLLLTLHKTGIDRQLAHLNVESQKLKDMIGKEYNKMNNFGDIIDVFKQIDHSFDGSVNSIAEQSAPQTTAKTPPTSKAIQPPDPIKTELITTIKHNDVLTKQILHKIDKNTDILQSFLLKLSDKIQPPVVTEKTFKRANAILSNSAEVKSPFLDKIHKINHSIPLIYTFQHPIKNNKEKTANSVASVVYHGHIVTKSGHSYTGSNDLFKDMGKDLKVDKENKKKGPHNATKFFIDDMEPDFKLGPNYIRFTTIKPLLNHTTAN